VGEWKVLCFSRVSRLKEEYKRHLQTLGATGAGLAPEDVTPDSEMANLVGKHLSASSPLYLICRTASIVSEWPWWKEFHSFWRELPNYNPIAVTTSTPGVDHAGQAATIFESTGHGDVQDSETGAIADEELNSDSANEAEEDGGKGKELDELSVVRRPNFLWSLVV